MSESFSAWCRRHGFEPATVRMRMKRRKCSKEEAISEPVLSPKESGSRSHGVQKSLAQKCRENGIAYGTVRFRIKKMKMDELSALSTRILSRKEIGARISKALSERSSDSIAALSRRLGVSASTVRARIAAGVPPEKSRNVGGRKVFGPCLSDLAKLAGINYGTLRKRIRKYGMTISEALESPVMQRPEIRKRSATAARENAAKKVALRDSVRILLARSALFSKLEKFE